MSITLWCFLPPLFIVSLCFLIKMDHQRNNSRRKKKRALYPVLSWYLKRAWTLIILHLIKEHLVPFEENCIEITLIKFDSQVFYNKNKGNSTFTVYCTNLCGKNTSILRIPMSALDNTSWDNTRKWKVDLNN